jgi:hypothetical protein
VARPFRAAKRITHKKPISPQVLVYLADIRTMRHPSIRGIGIRFLLAMTLPVTGIALVLWTVAQLLIYEITHA